MTATSHIRFGRCYEFTAAHRLHSDAFSAEKNQEVYGKCNNPAGHGHNYRCTVIIQGVPDLTTGMIMNMVLLDDIARDIFADYDYKHLDREVKAFENKQSTAENIVEALWSRFEKELAPVDGVDLHQVNISETRNNQAKLSRLN